MNLDFPVNSMNDDFQCLNVNITDDTLVEGNETFTVTLMPLATGLDVTAVNDATILTITDNEGFLY